MKLNHKTLSIVFGGMIVIGIVGAMVTYRLPWESKREIVMYTAKNADIQHLIVRADVSEVVILPIEAEFIRVEASDMHSQDVFRVTEDEATLTLEVKNRRNFKFVGFSPQRRYEQILTIYMPTSHYESIDVRNNVGNIDISGTSATELKVRNDVGDVSLQCTGSGSINVTNNVGNVSLEVANANRNVQLKNNVGNIDFLISKEPENVRIMTSSSIGRVNSNLADTHFGNAENLVTLITDIGDVNIRLIR